MPLVQLQESDSLGDIRVHDSCDDILFARDLPAATMPSYLATTRMDSVVWRDAKQPHWFIVLIEVGDHGVLA